MNVRLDSMRESVLDEVRAMRRAPIRIVVADDHPIVREGIIANLARQRDMKVVGQGGDGVEVLALIQQFAPELVLLDLCMPRMDGLNLLKQIKQLQISTKVIVLTTFESEEDIQNAVSLGARGYLLKDCSQPTLVEAIRRVHGGEVFLLPHIAQKLVERMQTPRLSPRELEVLSSVAAGKSNKEIGVQLFISEGTVKTHVASLLLKLGVASRTSAIKEAVRRGLVHLA
jgi:two-component system, NarL family, response regulator